MRYELYFRNGLWYWRLRAGNNEIIASGEGYHQKVSAQHAVGLLMDTSRNTPFHEVPG